MMTKAEKCQYWHQHIDNWRQSGKPQRVFCTENQLSYSTFSYWRTKLNRGQKAENKWLPVHVAPSAAVAVCLPGGIRLEVPAPALADVLPVVYRSLAETR